MGLPADSSADELYLLHAYSEQRISVGSRRDRNEEHAINVWAWLCKHYKFREDPSDVDSIAPAVPLDEPKDSHGKPFAESAAQLKKGRKRGRDKKVKLLRLWRRAFRNYKSWLP